MPSLFLYSVTHPLIRFLPRVGQRSSLKLSERSKSVIGHGSLSACNLRNEMRSESWDNSSELLASDAHCILSRSCETEGMADLSVHCSFNCGAIRNQRGDTSWLCGSYDIHMRPSSFEIMMCELSTNLAADYLRLDAPVCRGVRNSLAK